MKLALCCSVFALSALYAVPTLADYTPDNSYLNCGRYLVAIEVPWSQRIENKFDEYQATQGARIFYGFEEIVTGKAAETPQISDGGRAFEDRIYVYPDDRFSIDRRSLVMTHFEPKTESQLQSDAVFSDPYEETSSYWERTTQCEVTTKRQLQQTVEDHNHGLGSGGRKF